MKSILFYFLCLKIYESCLKYDKFFYGKFELIINLINFIEESLDII